VARFGKKLKVEWSNSQLIPTLLLSIYSGRWAAWRAGNKGVRCPAYFVYLCYPSSLSHRIERVLGILGIVSGLGVEETGKPFLSRAG